jgi:hypothetical protein
LIDLKTIEVKKHYKQVTDIQTAIDVQFGDKSPFHLKIKELQTEISDIPRALDESPQLKRKFDEAQKTLKTCASFRPRTGGFFIRLFLGQVTSASIRISVLLVTICTVLQVNVVEFSSTAKQMLKSEYLKFRDRCKEIVQLLLCRLGFLMFVLSPGPRLYSFCGLSFS